MAIKQKEFDARIAAIETHDNGTCHHPAGEVCPATQPDTTTKATADLATPITATLFHGETRHEIKDASGRIILIADILPEHVELIVRAVNRDAAFDAMVGALRYARTEIDILPPKQRQQRKVALQMIDTALAQADSGENGGGR